MQLGKKSPNWEKRQKKINEMALKMRNWNKLLLGEEEDNEKKAPKDQKEQKNQAQSSLPFGSSIISRKSLDKQITKMMTSPAEENPEEKGEETLESLAGRKEGRNQAENFIKRLSMAQRREYMQDKKELETEVAGECPLCGIEMIESVYTLFEISEEERDSWID